MVPSLAKIIKIIHTANLKGFAGDCGETAIALNRVLFENKGTYVAAVNDYYWSNEYPFFGHVGVLYKGKIFDSTGVIDKEAFRAWGMLDPEEEDALNPSRSLGDWAYDASIIKIASSFDDAEKAVIEYTKSSCPLTLKIKDLEEARDKVLKGSKVSSIISKHITSTRRVFYHGTSSVFSRKILKEGLNPKPKDRVYGEGENIGGGRSLETFGGTYFTTELGYATAAAIKACEKYGGNPLVAYIYADDRTPSIKLDEDTFFILLDKVTGLNSIMNIEKFLSRYIPNIDADPRDPGFRDEAVRLLQNMSLDNHLTDIKAHLYDTQGLEYRLENNWKTIKPVLKKTLQIEFIHTLDSLLRRKDLYNEYEESFKTLKKESEYLLSLIPELKYSQLNDNQSLRSMDTVGFSGKNKILSIYEFKPNWRPMNKSGAQGYSVKHFVPVQIYGDIDGEYVQSSAESLHKSVEFDLFKDLDFRTAT